MKEERRKAFHEAADRILKAVDAREVKRTDEERSLRVTVTNEEIPAFFSVLPGGRFRVESWSGDTEETVRSKGDATRLLKKTLDTKKEG